MLLKLTENTYHQLNNDYMGLCHNCGNVADCCEPDARNYACEACGENQVFGTDESLVMGKIELCDSQDQENIKW